MPAEGVEALLHQWSRPIVQLVPLWGLELDLQSVGCSLALVGKSVPPSLPDSSKEDELLSAGLSSQRLQRPCKPNLREVSVLGTALY